MPSRRPEILESDIRGYLTVSETDHEMYGVEVPIVQATTTFTLGQIPEATFVLAVGVDPLDRSKVSASHRLIETLTTSTKIEVYLQIRGKTFSGAKGGIVSWPREYFKFWSGKVVGVGHAASRGRVYYTVNSAHWLSDLESGTLTSEAVVRGDVDNFMVQVAPVTGGVPAISRTLLSAAERGMAGASDSYDIYRDVLLPMFAKLMLPVSPGETPGSSAGGVHTTSAYDRLVTHMGRLIGRSSVVSEEAARELMSASNHAGNEPAYRILSEVFNNAEHINPGNLTIDYTDRPVIVKEMLAYTSEAMAQNVGSYGAFSKLITMSGLHNFSVVPTINSATCAPIMPVFKAGLEWRRISLEEYGVVEGRSFLPKQLAGVLMVGSVNHSTGVNLAPHNLNLAGGYIGYPEGRLKIINAPGQMNIVPNVERVLDTVPSGPNIEEADIIKAHENACNFSKSYWAFEVFKHRTTTITGPVRFDICPGSPIRIDGMNISPTGNLNESDSSVLYGSVVAVRTVIDSQSPGANTSMVISHLRNASEEASALDVHPIYKNVWPGSPLAVIFDSDLQAKPG